MAVAVTVAVLTSPFIIHTTLLLCGDSNDHVRESDAPTRRTAHSDERPKRMTRRQLLLLLLASSRTFVSGVYRVGGADATTDGWMDGWMDG